MNRVLLILVISSGFASAQGLTGAGGGYPQISTSPPSRIGGAAAQAGAGFSGSVPSSEPVTGTLSLTLQDAIQRGLRQNLGIILGSETARLTQAQALDARSRLLPNLTGRVMDSSQQVNLAAYGFTGFPGIPQIVGPFNLFDARVYFTQAVLDFQLRNSSHAAEHQARAANLSLQDARDTVVQVVASGYLLVIADQAHVDEARAEVNTAQALFQRAQDQLQAGLSPALDALRAQVELQAEQTRLRAYENDLSKDQLALARLIGLPLAQGFVLADRAPYAELEPLSLDEALDRALKTRSDYLSAQQAQQAAESARRAAVAERYPAIDANADYGDIGPRPWSSHGTYTAAIGIRFPIWEGGRIRADIEQAAAELQQRRAELADLRARIEYDLRTAMLDLQTASDQVKVAASSTDVARQALAQAQDRFSAGVADNIEVVEAQNALAGATATYIDSLFAHNTAKVNLARALGMTSEGVKQYLGAK